MITINDNYSGNTAWDFFLVQYFFKFAKKINKMLDKFQEVCYTIFVSKINNLKIKF